MWYVLVLDKCDFVRENWNCLVYGKLLFYGWYIRNVNFLCYFIFSIVVIVFNYYFIFKMSCNFVFLKGNK